MTTIGYHVKRSLRDAMRGLAVDSAPLAGYDVRYAPTPSTRRAVYFGGLRSTQVDDASNGNADTLAKETATVMMYLRVIESASVADDPYEDADRELERAGDAFGGWLADHRDFAGPGTWATITATYGDYASSDSDVTATCAYAVTVTGYVDLAQRP